MAGSTLLVARSRAGGRALGLALALVVSLLSAGQAMADPWYEHYARAERALAAEDWTLAVAELNEAIRRKADSGARERTHGMWVVAYFPYLKLGIAYTRMGQYEAALQAFETEERLGAVRASETAGAELERFRELARAGRREASESAAERVAGMVEESLAQAATLEREGRLGEAMSAVDRALAVAPGHAEAGKVMARLREAASAGERARQDGERARAWVTEARQALVEKRWAAAASLLRQALASAPDAETERLLRQAEEGLRAALAAEGAAAHGRQAIARALEEVSSLVAAGQLVAALERLQPVLAAEPENPQAVALLERCVEGRRQAERAEGVRLAVAEGEAHLAAGRAEAALAAVNRALGLEPRDAAALALVQRAYAQLGESLLGTPGAKSLPPAIRFQDLRELREDGSRVQVVRVPELRLGGVILDRSEVSISIIDDRGRPLPVESRPQPVGELVLTEFSLVSRLATGQTTFRVQARNAAGLESRAEYAVLYQRPLTRSPWFVGGIVTLVLVGAGALAGVRGWRRRQLRRRKYNPYVAGAPVLDERLFFGREQLIGRVLQTIHNNSLLLHGERRIGKTSLLHQLKRRLQDLDDPVFAFFPVFVDLQGTPEERFFATLGTEIVDELKAILPAGTVAAPGRDGTEYGHRELVRDLRVIIEALARTTPRHVKLVLLIDEVDELNAYDPRVNQRLRSLFMRAFAEHLVAVVAGVEIRKQWEQHGSPWYNFFEEIELTPIARDAAEALVRTPLRGVFTIEDDAVAAICEITECKPYPIQRACVALVSRLHQHGRRTVTRADVEAVCGESRP